MNLRTKILVNPTAGRGRSGEVLEQVERYLKRYGVDGDLVVTEAPGQATDLAFEAALDGYDRVVAMGGDGTAIEVTNGLLRAQEQGGHAVLGVLPAGSGNDFAYGVGVPGDLEAACRQLVEGQERTVDLVRVTVDGRSKVFINAVGVGYDADVLLETRKIQNARGVFLYLLGVLRVWASRGKWPYPVRITVDGKLLPQDLVTLVTVSNGPRSGGGFFLNPDAKTDDGYFNVCVASRVNRLQIWPLLVRVMRGTHVKVPQVTLMQARHLVIESRRETGLPGHMDGEVLCTAGKRIEFEILPAHLTVWS